MVGKNVEGSSQPAPGVMLYREKANVILVLALSKASLSGCHRCINELHLCVVLITQLSASSCLPTPFLDERFEIGVEEELVIWDLTNGRENRGGSSHVSPHRNRGLTWVSRQFWHQLSPFILGGYCKIPVFVIYNIHSPLSFVNPCDKVVATVTKSCLFTRYNERLILQLGSRRTAITRSI